MVYIDLVQHKRPQHQITIQADGFFFASKQNVFKSHNYVSTHFGFVGEQTKNNKQKHHSNAISDSHSDKFTSFVCVCM